MKADVDWMIGAKIEFYWIMKADVDWMIGAKIEFYWIMTMVIV